MPDRMWSPWRSAYVERSGETGSAGADEPEADARSIFLQQAEAGDDAASLIVWRGAHVFVIMNRYPYNSGHLLVVPFRQVERYQDLTADEQHAIARTIERCIRWLDHALRPEGFNVGINMGAAAGAGIPHPLHVHVLPRWGGDTNFMPTTADVKVVPEAMRDTYRKLRRAVDVLGDDPATWAD